MTIYEVLLSIFIGILLFFFPNLRLFLLLSFVLFIRMALIAINGMPGMRASLKNYIGAILNEIGDVIFYIALYLPFIFFFPDAH